MHDQRAGLRFSSMGNWFVPPVPYPEDGGYYPEKRLWVAVVLETLAEYEAQLNQIKQIRQSSVQPVNRIFFFAIKRLRYECDHSWFKNICWLADIDPARVYAKFDELDIKYKLRKTNFTEIATVIPRERMGRVRREHRKNKRQHA